MKIKIAILLSCLMFVLNCNGQEKDHTKINKTVMREKIDLILLEKKAKKTPISLDAYTYEYSEITDSGELINITGSVEEGGFIENIIHAKPSFKKTYKEFYPDGYIKKKEIYVGEKTKIDISEYYDKKGKLHKVDENKKFGKIKPDDVLKFLEKKKVINLLTGTGRFNENGEASFEMLFDEQKKEYTIIITEGKPNTGPFDNGEPPAFLPLIYIMNGETGDFVEKN